MAVLYTNNAQGLLNAGITAIATTIVLQSGNGTLFPAISGSDFFYATLFNAGGTIEIVKVTARVSDTLTVVRAQEGTAGFAFSAADKCDLRITAAGLANKLDKDTGGTIAGALTVTGALVASGTFSSLSAAVTNNCTVGGTLGVTSNATVGGTFGVTGATTMAALTASGAFINTSATPPAFTTMPQVGAVNLVLTTDARLTGIVQQTHAVNYTGVLADAGGDEYFTATAAFTIPANAAVAYPIGTVKVLDAAVGVVLTVNITTDTLRWLPSNTTGSRTITGPGFLSIRKVTATEWWATGVNIT